MTRLSFEAGAATSFELVQSAQALRQAELALAAREFELRGRSLRCPGGGGIVRDPLSPGQRLLAGGDRRWRACRDAAGPAAARPRRSRPSRWRSRPWRPGQVEEASEYVGHPGLPAQRHRAAPGVGLRARDPGEARAGGEGRRQRLLRIDARQEAAVLAQTERRPGPGRDPAEAGDQHPARGPRPCSAEGIRSRQDSTAATAEEQAARANVQRGPGQRAGPERAGGLPRRDGAVRRAGGRHRGEGGRQPSPPRPCSPRWTRATAWRSRSRVPVEKAALVKARWADPDRAAGRRRQAAAARRRCSSSPPAPTPARQLVELRARPSRTPGPLRSGQRVRARVIWRSVPGADRAHLRRHPPDRAGLRVRRRPVTSRARPSCSAGR